jgi:hypothetical protein
MIIAIRRKNGINCLSRSVSVRADISFQYQMKKLWTKRQAKIKPTTRYNTKNRSPFQFSQDSGRKSNRFKAISKDSINVSKKKGILNTSTRTSSSSVIVRLVNRRMDLSTTQRTIHRPSNNTANTIDNEIPRSNQSPPERPKNTISMSVLHKSVEDIQVFICE